jgi:exopolysaccharide biosynthesis polyprenyl glycosylphosphotransferase
VSAAHTSDVTAEVPRPEARFSPWRGDPLRRRLLACADLFTAACFATALWWFGGVAWWTVLWTLVALPLWLILAKLHGLYDRDHQALRHVTADEVPELFLWATTSSAVTVLLGLAFRDTVTAMSVLGATGVALAVAAPGRVLARSLWRRIVPSARVVIVGESELAAAARRKIELFADIHAVVLDDLSLGKADALLRAAGELAEGGVDRVIVTGLSVPASLIVDLLGYCRSCGARLTLVPPAWGRLGSVSRLTHVAELPVLDYNTWDIPRSTLLLKRAFDVVAGLLALFLLIIPIVLIATATYAYDRGPVLFRQRRAGALGVPFTMWKFRTMVTDAEEQLSSLIQFDQLVEPVFKLHRDPRVTPIGRLLRRFSLDELPQLVNVLRGEMSIVGPRPEQVELVARYTEEQALRLSVKPGLTGPMQVYGRGELSLEERLVVERDYIENLSLGRDFRILAHTVGAVLTGRGAF